MMSLSVSPGTNPRIDVIAQSVSVWQIMLGCAMSLFTAGVTSAFFYGSLTTDKELDDKFILIQAQLTKIESVIEVHDLWARQERDAMQKDIVLMAKDISKIQGFLKKR